ncbi:MAG: YCF48-related protein [bacterium]
MKKIRLFILLFIIMAVGVYAQDKENKNDSLDTGIFNGLKWRSIGPALTSGRIADFAVNPNNNSEYFVAVASGNVWKTTNNGTTFEPVFDNYGAYSIGCVTIDPNNPFVVWIGTGENNHQRALGYGDGVYKSVDGGKTWKNTGLKESRQIGDIIIDPRNSNIVFVAAEGSVWGPGKERGLYKTIDGGKTWKKVLDISENTGVNNVLFDPRTPDVMYATSEQRRRHVFTKIGGGPESAVYKSFDAGETWEKIMEGLPNVDLGGMGIDISPVNPDVLYLIVEAAEGKGGFFRSVNRGATWEKMNSYTSSGQYYNEIYCDPKNVDIVYSTETVSKVTNDGGKTWKSISINERHVDDHALWIDPSDTKHYLIGGDGGVYETYDLGLTFDFKENLPVTQFYRVAVDNTLPFYFVYGGTQDNNSLGAPSQTINSDGIVNSDWFVTNGGDGFWSAIDPQDPNIVYAESQYGGMVRYDKKSGEAIDIRPEPKSGELTYKWNWDTPLFLSPFSNTRLYCSANKVFRSDDRGNTWQVISDDLTAQIDRNTWKVMDKYWSYDAVAKDKSTSLFGTIISLCESPVKENLLFAGTDDGLIQISEDAKTWKKIEKFTGVPENTYVSDICPSKFDENIVFASFNNLLRDDFKPYILKSIDKGKTWKSITGNLPANGSINTIEQDYVNPDLLFVGTEFGIFCTTDGGEKWLPLKSGLPVISVKDITIQKRENDLVIATFGRGIYILDNYTPLRYTDKSTLDKDAYIYPIKDALMFVKSYSGGSLGSTHFKSPNADFGAVFTYYVKDVPKTLKQERKEIEKKLFKDGKPIPQPIDSLLFAEKEEIAPYFVCTITDDMGNVVRKINTSANKGIQRLVWDLTYPSLSPVDKVEKFDPVAKSRGSNLVMPGKYKVSLALVSRLGIKNLVEPVEFNTVPLRNTTLPIDDRKELIAFQKKSNELARTIGGTNKLITDLIERIKSIKQALINTPDAPQELFTKANDVYFKLRTIAGKFERESDSPSAEENMPSQVTINERINVLAYTHWRSTSNITQNEKNAYAAIMEQFPPLLESLKSIYNVNIKQIETEMEKYKTPYTPGRIPELTK